MKIEGVKLGVPSEQLICFPRVDAETGEGYEIAFKVRAVLDFDEFDKLVPMPDEVIKTFPGGKTEIDLKDVDYLKAHLNRSTKKVEYMVLKALEATDGLTWDTVKLSDPETWGLWEGEMQESGFNSMEVQRLHMLAMQVNSFDEETLEEAKANFLRRQAAEKEKEKQAE